MLDELVPPALLALAAILGCGISGGQIVRCVHRKRSDDVSISGWLAGAASGTCLVVVCFVTHSSLWLAFWEGTGVMECLLTAFVAWKYRSPAVSTG